MNILRRLFSTKKPKLPLDALLIRNSPVKNKTHLKKQLIKAGYLKEKCLWCGIGPVWRGKPLTLEMDHINGDNTDNRLTNLRILCLNCHAQTPTFRRPKTGVKLIEPKPKGRSWMKIIALVAGVLIVICIGAACVIFILL